MQRLHRHLRLVPKTRTTQVEFFRFAASARRAPPLRIRAACSRQTATRGKSAGVMSNHATLRGRVPIWSRARRAIAARAASRRRSALPGRRIAIGRQNRPTQSRQRKERKQRRQIEKLAQHWSWAPPYFASFVQSALLLYDRRPANELIWNNTAMRRVRALLARPRASRIGGHLKPTRINDASGCIVPVRQRQPSCDQATAPNLSWRIAVDPNQRAI